MKALLISVLIISVVYSLQALGFVLVIRGTGVLNFAQGQMLALGGYIYYDLITRFNGPFVLTALAMLAISALLGVVIYRVVLIRLEGAPIWAVVMALFGIGAMLDAFLQIQWGPNARFLPLPVEIRKIDLPFGFTTNPLDVLVVGVSVAFIVGLLALIYLTPLGLRMRASAENKTLAAYAGVNVERIGTISWVLASAYVGLAGLALALRTTVSPELEAAFLTAFPAVVVGGFESIVGAVVGAFVLGAITQFGINYFGSDLALPLAYLVLLLMLVVRPQGLFGARDIIRI